MSNAKQLCSRSESGEFVFKGHVMARSHMLDLVRAATNDYFDNRLLGRLFFRLIGLNTNILFY